MIKMAQYGICQDHESILDLIDTTVGSEINSRIFYSRLKNKETVNRRIFTIFFIDVFGFYAISSNKDTMDSYMSWSAEEFDNFCETAVEDEIDVIYDDAIKEVFMHMSTCPKFRSKDNPMPENVGDVVSFINELKKHNEKESSQRIFNAMLNFLRDLGHLIFEGI